MIDIWIKDLWQEIPIEVIAAISSLSEIVGDDELAECLGKVRHALMDKSWVFIWRSTRYQIEDSGFIKNIQAL